MSELSVSLQTAPPENVHADDVIIVDRITAPGACVVSCAQIGQSKYCGLFKTPTLRNVATRNVFFHNGRIHTRKKRFYERRDTDPQLWYPVSSSRAADAQRRRFSSLD